MDFLENFLKKTYILRISIYFIIFCTLIHYISIRHYCLAAFDIHQVEAAFIYNLTNFIRWPQTTLKKVDNSFTICVIGNTKVASNLSILTQGEVVKGKKLIVNEIQDPSKLEKCCILFVGKSFHGDLKNLLQQVRGKGVLTIGESDLFLEEGGMVAFILKENKIQITINIQASRKEGFSFNSKLLKIAKLYKATRLWGEQ